MPEDIKAHISFLFFVLFWINSTTSSLYSEVSGSSNISQIFFLLTCTSFSYFLLYIWSLPLFSQCILTRIKTWCIFKCWIILVQSVRRFHICTYIYPEIGEEINFAGGYKSYTIYLSFYHFVIWTLEYF